MDWSKYPLDRLVYFVAALVPGFSALLIFQLTYPGSFAWFFALGFLGYRTKIALILIAAFVIGYSMSTFLSHVLGMLGGAIGSLMPYKNPVSESVAPWRDPRWRHALSCHLGAQTPEDTLLMTQGVYNWRMQLIDQLPEPERQGATAALSVEKINTEMNDSRWSQWYEHFHTIVIGEWGREWMAQVRHGLDFNLKTTALYVLTSSIWVPSLRHWWFLAPAVVWTVLFLVGEWAGLLQYTNRWSTLSAQIKYLFEVKPVALQGSLFGGHNLGQKGPA